MPSPMPSTMLPTLPAMPSSTQSSLYATSSVDGRSHIKSSTPLRHTSPLPHFGQKAFLFSKPLLTPTQETSKPSTYPIRRPPIPPAPLPQKLPVVPRVHPTSPTVATPIPQPTVKFTLTATLRVEAPTPFAHWTCSHTTTDPIVPFGNPSQAHTSLFLHKVPLIPIHHPCPRLQP
jgi:hypothetical protein